MTQKGKTDQIVIWSLQTSHPVQASDLSVEFSVNHVTTGIIHSCALREIARSQGYGDVYLLPRDSFDSKVNKATLLFAGRKGDNGRFTWWGKGDNFSRWHKHYGTLGLVGERTGENCFTGVTRR